jgi:hypothetical protein
MRHVRSLYVPHIVGHPHGANLDIQETALHVVDIVSLRPEMELCYMAIGGKCFEILERQGPAPRRRSMQHSQRGRSERIRQDEVADADADGDEEEHDEEEHDEDEGDEADDENDESEDEIEGSIESEVSDNDHVETRKASKLWLQEILFYDKITIFKARHGRL